MGKKITLEVPDQLDMTEKEVVLMLAALLYKDGRLSAGHAADFAGVDKRTFIESLGKYGVSFMNFEASEVEQDIRNATHGRK